MALHEQTQRRIQVTGTDELENVLIGVARTNRAAIRNYPPGSSGKITDRTA